MTPIAINHQKLFKTILGVLVCLYTSILLSSCVGFGLEKSDPPKREFRAIWIATVVNIDWPTQNNLTVAKQKEEFITLLDAYKKLNFNAVIVQVRAAGDAFYPSSYDPWSKYLTGKEGKAPQPNYDPLKWMIDQAHERGMEFHAWFNPYRATFDLDTAILSDTHAFNQHPEWMVRYGKKFYFNPGLPEVIDYTRNVVLEVVNNYKVDGIHFDDYFYPYKEAGKTFDDKAAYNEYANEQTSLDDWRRNNVNQLVKNINDSIKAVKPWVQFGISPFGVWRNKSTDPKGSATRAGQTTYDDLYADPLLWMQQEWIDYILPQVYWTMDFPAASHRTLVEWWANQEYDGALYIGHGLYKVKANADKDWNKYNEIPKQIINTRSYESVNGGAFFSAKSLLGNHERLKKKIKKYIYPYPALTPKVPFIAAQPAEKPVINASRINNKEITIALNQPEKKQQAIVVYAFFQEEQNSINDPANILHEHYLKHRTAFSLKIDASKLDELKGLAITYLNQYGKESQPVFLQVDEALSSIQNK